jgi:hypothetical protein
MSCILQSETSKKIDTRSSFSYSGSSQFFIIEAKTVNLIDSTIKRLDGSVKAETLRVSPLIEFIGPNVDVETVAVETMFHTVKVTLSEALKAIAINGNLKQMVAKQFRTPFLTAGYYGEGKSTLISHMMRERLRDLRVPN